MMKLLLFVLALSLFVNVPAPSQQSNEDARRCRCWYEGWDTKKRGQPIDDPLNQDCNRDSLKQQFEDGWKANRDKEPRKCPYKR